MVYRDLRPENILIGNDGYIKLVDFGLSQANVKSDTEIKSLCGTPEYVAPEVLKNEGYGKPVDLWQYGCIIYEMMTGTTPFGHENR